MKHRQVCGFDQLPDGCSPIRLSFAGRPFVLSCNDDPLMATRNCTMALEPRFRMGASPRSFAVDAHDCIMVRLLQIGRIRICGTNPRLMASPPRNCHCEFNAADGWQSAAVLVTVRGKSLPAGLSATLDHHCAAASENHVGTRRLSLLRRTRGLKMTTGQP